MTGWWYTYPSEKHAFVSGEDDIPNIPVYIYMESHKIHVPNHRPVIYNRLLSIWLFNIAMDKIHHF